MSSVPLTFNNGQSATTSDIAVIKEGGKTIQERGGIAGAINRTLKNEQAEKNYVVSEITEQNYQICKDMLDRAHIFWQITHWLGITRE